MLKIEKIHITGFKSFADPTEIYLGDGITAVVGPNGCGKSNLSDAISWVLGEQSAKSLRGSKMEDVIFNGTRDRKPMGMAEVLLTLVAVEDLVAQIDDDDIELPDEPEIEIDEGLAHPQGAAEAATGDDDGESLAADGAPAPEGAEHADAQHESAPKTKKRRHPRRRVMPDLPKLAAGDRVTVGRRLYRSGESDYIMNGRSCRLRDIQDLFAGTGLGGAHYAIIEQGRIGQILSSKPQDRRALIEEAAGITKFKSRKRAAELRLESARQNLTRLNDIVYEVERQIASLKRQAAKARRYRRLKDEMRTLLRDVFAADWERLESELDRLANLARIAREAQGEIAAELSERETEHRSVAARAREAEDALVAVRDRVASIELEADRARNRSQYQREQIAELMLRREELARERDAAAERLDLIDAERERKTEEHTRLSKETDGEAARLAEQEAAYQSRLHALDEKERELEALRSRLVVEVGRTERLGNMQLQLDEVERRLGFDASRLDRELASASARREEAEEQLERLAEEIQMGEARLEEIRREIRERVEALAGARRAAEQAAASLADLQERRSARAHRLASLEDLDQRHAYYSEAVQQVLNLDENFNALGTLADYADASAEYERALESLFGRELQSILVPGIDDAVSGVEYLVGTDAGRAAFLVVGAGGGEEGPHDRATRGIGENGVSVLDPPLPRPALSLLKLPTEIERAVERAYPEKARALVVASLDDALVRSRAAEAEGDSRIFVTVAGEMVVNGRVVVGGSAVSQGAHVLGLKREIRDLKAELEEIVWQVSEAEAKLSEALKEVARLEGESASLGEALRTGEDQTIQRSMRVDQLKTDLERAAQHLRVIESEQTRLDEEREELSGRRKQLEADLEAANAERREVERELEGARDRVIELRGQIDAEGRVLAEARAAAAARQERRRAVGSELKRLADEKSELTSRRDRNHTEGIEIENRIEQLGVSISEAEGQTERYSTEREGMSEALDRAMAELNAARERADALEDELVEVRERLEAARARISDIEVERARLLSDAEHVRRGAVNELSQEIEEVVEAAREARTSGQPAEPDEMVEDDEDGGEAAREDPAEGARERLDQIRRILDQIGAVNMMALEELEEAEERFVFLTTQRRDILDSIEATDSALSEIKRRSRVRFREAFAEINRNFGDMFQELFGGGRGEMVMLDEEDLLESGIDIIAQPPGKRLQNVLLLSGGEKAMTAIALVLAIFKYKPSPFCILDEVDAPLDEVNVGRFSDHIIEMSEGTQFLVITHSKRTMEAARALYGVTMEQPGVSKLVSVKFTDEGAVEHDVMAVGD